MSAWLFVPGHDRRKLLKALTGDADVVVVDWEDGVPARERERARIETRDTLHSRPPVARIVIRINAAGGSEWEADLATVRGMLDRGAAIGGLMLPKVNAVEQIAELAFMELPLVATIEGAAGLELVSSLARAHPKLERLALGSLDLLAELGQRWRADQPLLEHARVRIALASRAAGLEPPVDGIFPPLHDHQGLALDASRARDLGFAAKLVIHPGQIAPVQTAFRANQDELELARRTLAAYQKALEGGSAATSLDGEMIDAPSVAWAKRTLGIE